MKGAADGWQEPQQILCEMHQGGTGCLYTVASSPDLSPIEHLWAQLSVELLWLCLVLPHATEAPVCLNESIVKLPKIVLFLQILIM